MTADYTDVIADALEAITESGGVVTFPGAIPGTPATYDEATDTWSGGTAPTDAAGVALQVKSNPDTFRALSLVLVNPVTLKIAAGGLAITPVVGMAFLWADIAYVIKSVETLAPSGDPIIYTVIGSAG